ncbi:MAG TPA: AAA family ATPase [Gaiellales bacterium]|nr:AAA family ATPase [Gaiellales bacterium]
MLVGRDKEQRVLDDLLRAAHEGQGMALVLEGDPGIGKTALLEAMAQRAEGFLVLRALGTETEMAIDYAALHQLLRGGMQLLDGLPGAQRSALHVALGMKAGAAPDEFQVGLGVLGMLGEGTAQQPILCLIDDAQWIDHASLFACGFVARRLQAERAAICFACHRADEVRELAGIPVLRIGPLDHDAAGRLLDEQVPGRQDPAVRERLLSEMRGNPLALRELPYGLTVEQISGGFGLPTLLPLIGRIEDSYRRRVDRLPAETRQLLLVAACDSTGDAALFRAAARFLGLDPAATAPAEQARLVEVDEKRISFHHPIIRAVVYRDATQVERQQAHRALAAVMDETEAPERRAWQLARAADGPDEALADLLEQTAGRAERRGGIAAGAAFMERAAQLSVDPHRRSVRMIAAARGKLEVGAVDAAGAILAEIDLDPLSEMERLRARLLATEVEGMRSNACNVVQDLLAVAEDLARHDAYLARETYLEALEANTYAGFYSEEGTAAVAAACAQAPVVEHPRGIDLLLDALVKRFLVGPREAAPMVDSALEAMVPIEDLRWVSLGIRAAVDAWDAVGADRLAEAAARAGRTTSRLRSLPLALDYLAIIHGARDGRLRYAEELVDEAESISAAMGLEPWYYGRLMLTAERGDAVVFQSLASRAHDRAQRHKDGSLAVYCRICEAVLHIGLRNYRAALTTALRVATEDGLGHSILLPELIESAVRVGDMATAQDGVEQLAPHMADRPGAYAQGMWARSRALVSEGSEAAALYEQAIDGLGAGPTRWHLARARLLYGEWLRRQGERVAAREQLRVAYEQFSAFGGQGFAERAYDELAATGEHARRRTPQTRDELTPQELRIAGLARDGYSNPDIAARLFISRSTVEYHLHKVYVKLGIGSRAELQTALGADTADDQLTAVP